MKKLISCLTFILILGTCYGDNENKEVHDAQYYARAACYDIDPCLTVNVYCDTINYYSYGLNDVDGWCKFCDKVLGNMWQYEQENNTCLLGIRDNCTSLVNTDFCVEYKLNSTR